VGHPPGPTAAGESPESGNGKGSKICSVYVRNTKPANERPLWAFHSSFTLFVALV
jgi:hypothetical protein